MKFYSSLLVICLAWLFVACGSDSNPNIPSDIDDPNSLGQNVIKATIGNDKWETNYGRFINLTKSISGAMQESAKPSIITNLSCSLPDGVNEVKVGKYSNCLGSVVQKNGETLTTWSDKNSEVEITSVTDNNIKGKFVMNKAINHNDSTSIIIKGSFNLSKL